MPRLFALPLLPLLAVAAPVPKAMVPKIEDVFGEIADKKSECKFEMGKGGALTITVPKGAVGSEKPLVSKEVEGDFILTTRVKLEYPADASGGNGKKPPAVSVGLGFTSQDDTKLHSQLFWTVTSTPKAGWEGTIIFASNTRKGGGIYAPKLCSKEGSLYLRLTRQGASVVGEVSEDGVGWKVFSGAFGHRAMADRLTVGPVAFGTIDKEFTATFDEYEIKPLPKDEKK